MRWKATLAALAALGLAGQAALAQDAEAARAAAQEMVDAIVGGERGTQSPAVCKLLESGLVADVLGAEPADISYRPASKFVPQGLCTATWQGIEVALTVIKTQFESNEAAVESLESAVASLEKGLTVTVGGRERTKQVDFEDWMDGVGDQAAWAPALSELSVAANGLRFAVTVRGADDATNRERAIALARKVASSL